MTSSDEKASVLIVEDEWIIAAQIQAIVSEAGFVVIGPLADLEAALRVAEDEVLSAALLDVDLGPGVEVYPVADALQNRGVPFAFVTSKRRSQIPPAHAGRPLVGKPFHAGEIEAVLSSIL